MIKFILALLLSVSLVGCKKRCCCQSSNSSRNIIIITGPSGSGKTTVGEKLASEFNIARSISATSREKRFGEKDGTDYYFKTKEEMKNMIENDELIEYSEHFGNIYGIPKSNLDKLKKQDLMFIIDYNGAEKLSKIATGNRKSTSAKFIRIYLDINPRAALQRIEKRGDKINSKDLKERLNRDKNIDLSKYFVVDTSNISKDEVYKKVKDIYNEYK